MDRRVPLVERLSQLKRKIQEAPLTFPLEDLLTPTALEEIKHRYRFSLCEWTKTVLLDVLSHKITVDQAFDRIDSIETWLYLDQ